MRASLASMIPESVEEVQAALDEAGYVADRSLAVVIFLALKVQRPMLLEGEAGVGKTEVAKVLSRMLGDDLIRLQCYEGLDVGHALYEWDYARQMLAIRLAESGGRASEVGDIMSREFIVARPLLQAVERGARGERTVLLIDEIDRADEEFEAYLLELLSDFQVTIPEIGTIEAVQRPTVVITSNRTREIHDALKRRCIYHWIDYPDFERERAILLRKAPDLGERLTDQIARAMQHLRSDDLFKPPGVAESLDWAAALAVLGETELTPEVLSETMGVVLKYHEDLDRVRAAGVEHVLDSA